MPKGPKGQKRPADVIGKVACVRDRCNSGIDLCGPKKWAPGRGEPRRRCYRGTTSGERWLAVYFPTFFLRNVHAEQHHLH
jgi:hypothetical protein